MPKKSTKKRSRRSLRKSRRQRGGLLGMSSTLNKFSEFANHKQAALVNDLLVKQLIVLEGSDFKLKYWSAQNWDEIFKKAYYEQTDPVKHQEIKDFIAQKYKQSMGIQGRSPEL